MVSPLPSSSLSFSRRCSRSNCFSFGLTSAVCESKTIQLNVNTAEFPYNRIPWHIKHEDMGRKLEEIKNAHKISVRKPDRNRPLRRLQVTNSMELSPFLKSYQVLSWSRNSPHFMEPKGSLLHAQKPATVPILSQIDLGQTPIPLLKDPF